MGSPRPKPLGLALAGALLTVALAACATGHSSPAKQPPPSASHAAVSDASADEAPSVTAGTPKQQAEADAATLLRLFAVPPGGHRLAGPPSLPGGVLKTPLSYLGAAWEVHLTGFWQAPGTPQALLAWEQAHLPRFFTLGDADFGPPAWDREFDVAPMGDLISRELIVEVASAGDGQTGIRLDAWVAWQPPRPAGSTIPATARTVAVATMNNNSLAVGRLPAPVTVANRATVRALAALINRLPLSTISPDASCPPPLGPFLSLTFRARPGGPALATVQTDQPCGAVGLTVNGKQQLALQNETTLDAQILKLAGLSWKL